MAKSIQYETYRLSRVVSIYAIVAADYLKGPYASKVLHSHENAWELCFCASGRLNVFQDDTTLSLKGGQCLIIPPGSSHKVSIPGEGDISFIMSFTCMDSYLSMLRGCITDATERQINRFEEILSEMRGAFELDHNRLRVMHFSPSSTSPLGAEQLICCYLEEILIDMLRSIIRTDGQSSRHTDLEAAVQSCLAAQVTAYIRKNLDEPISVESVSEHFHYSRARLGSIYKKTTGESLGQAINRERIVRAKELLAAGEKSVTEISEELCYSSPQYFSKKFTKAVGCPPSQYAQTLLEKP